MSRLFRHRRNVVYCLAFGAVLVGGFSIELLQASLEQTRAFGIVQPANRGGSLKRWAHGQKSFGSESPLLPRMVSI